MSFRIVLACCLALFSFAIAFADTYVVNPEGTGDLATIQAAIDASVDGDVIELADGEYRGEGNRDLSYLGKAITVRSQSGTAEACVIDCEGSDTDPHRGVSFVSGEQAGSVLAGVTIRGGQLSGFDAGGAILCDNASSPSIESCIFAENTDIAVSCESDCAVSITDCLFQQNKGYWGAGLRVHGAVLNINDCMFVENVSERGASAIDAFGATGEIVDCTFLRNKSGDIGAVSVVEGGPASVRNCLFQANVGGANGGLHFFLSPDNSVEGCTFVGNRGSTGALSSGKISRTYVRNCTFFANTGSQTIFCGNIEVFLDNTIVAYTIGGVGVRCPYDIVVLTCCDVVGNEEGDWVGRIADQQGVRGNITADPLFCDPEVGELTLNAESPCAPFTPPNADCDLIGAWPVSCGETPTVQSSWGLIKAQFRP